MNVFYDQFLPGVLQAIASWGAFWLFVWYVRRRVNVAVARAKARMAEQSRDFKDGDIFLASESNGQSVYNESVRVVTRVEHEFIGAGAIVDREVTEVKSYTCCCSSPGDTRKACGLSRNLKNPCRCACHSGKPFPGVDEYFGVPEWREKLRVELLRQLAATRSASLGMLELRGALTDKQLPRLIVVLKEDFVTKEATLPYVEVEAVAGEYGLSEVARRFLVKFGEML